MAKIPSRAGKLWTPAETRALKNLADANTPTRIIALKLDRTEPAVRAKASDAAISLKPTNQAPYGTKRK